MVRILTKLAAVRGAPRRIFCDYGSEFQPRIVDLWAYTHQVQLEFSRPGNPPDNAHIESFNDSLRDEYLNVHLVHVTCRCEGETEHPADRLQRESTLHLLSGLAQFKGYGHNPADQSTAPGRL